MIDRSNMHLKKKKIIPLLLNRSVQIGTIDLHHIGRVAHWSYIPLFLNTGNEMLCGSLVLRRNVPITRWWMREFRCVDYHKHVPALPFLIKICILRTAHATTGIGYMALNICVAEPPMLLTKLLKYKNFVISQGINWYTSSAGVDKNPKSISIRSVGLSANAMN